MTPAPYRARTIVTHGPESTGKSTLAETLAAHFGGILVPEYGREYCEIHGTDCDAQDLLNIAAGHNAAVDAAGRKTDGMIFSDTDALLTEVWSHMMLGESCFKAAPPRISGALYLLTDIDTPFVQDDLRVYGEDASRQHFFALSEAALKQYGVDYVKISGSWAEREAAAIAAVEARFSGMLTP
ncbi:AAA family ATPase [Maricaulaceae bacterium EIL42A08]|nr:AAA family ATPase [Maricaulaceae bacterium EIL42A08]